MIKMQGERNISIIIPVYNEGKSLPQIVKHLANLYKGFEIIVVDDESEDNSIEVSNIQGITYLLLEKCE